MKQRYKSHRFTPNAYKQIEVVNEIIDEYQADGYVLTVRQLYYQLVSRDLISNNEKSYKQLINLVTNGRIGGLIDWDMIEDRGRNFIRNSHWRSPGEMLVACAHQFDIDRWSNQDHRLYLVVEKEALVGVFENVCRRFDVPLLAAKGYPSVSVLREFAEDDLAVCIDNGQRPVLLHFGDHDPSGIDMSRDLIDRLSMFLGHDAWKLERLALNMDQVRSQRPPPNPAKKTDQRYQSYARKFNTNSSWELDALSPSFLAGLAEEAIESFIDTDNWNEKEEEVQSGRSKILEVAQQI